MYSYWRVDFPQPESNYLHVTYLEKDLDKLLDDVQANGKKFESPLRREKELRSVKSLKFKEQKYIYINNNLVTYVADAAQFPRNYVDDPFWVIKKFHVLDMTPDINICYRHELGDLAAMVLRWTGNGDESDKVEPEDQKVVKKDLLMMADRGLMRINYGKGVFVEYHGPHPASPSPEKDEGYAADPVGPVDPVGPPPVAEPVRPIMSAEDSDASEYFILLNLVSGTVTQIPMHNMLEATQVIYKLFVDLEVSVSQTEIFRDIDTIAKCSREIKQYSNKILMFCTNRD